MATIVVKARQIFDSRSNPAGEVDVKLSDGTLARAAVPSGASTGVYEALDLRDGGSDYLGKGVLKAVDNVNSIIGPALVGKDPAEQTASDNFVFQLVDETVNEWVWCKQKLDALAVSLAVCKAGARVKKIPLYKHIANLAGNKNLVLPVPAFNVINGGSHAGNKLAMQVFMNLPVGASSLKEAMWMGVEVYHHLKAGQDATNVGDEGGFAPNIQENKEGLELLKTAISKAGYTVKVVIGMDVAASDFYGTDKTYYLNFKEDNNDGSQKISGDALKDLYKSFVSVCPIVSIEDPFDQDDWEHYSKLTSEIGKEVQIVGDDPLVTNQKRVEKAINEKSCNALLLKGNQTGSVTESIEAVRMYKKAGWGVTASHCSGETVDTFIADLRVGLAKLTATVKANVVAGQLSIANLSSYALFDSGATHSFISTDHVNANQFDIGKYVTSKSFRTTLPSGDVLESTQFLRAVPVIVSNRELCADLIILDMCNYDVILGMDFLTKYNVSIECGMRRVTFRLDNEDEFKFEAELYPKQKAISTFSRRCQGFLASVVDTTQEEKAKPERHPGSNQDRSPL